MTLAKLLLRLWKLRLLVVLGGVLAIAAAGASIKLAKSPVYSAATTEMLIDSPTSVLGNADIDLSGYVTRADVFARLITSDEALRYVGQASGIPGHLIDATGPVEINGSPQAAHAPTATLGGPPLPATPEYKLDLTQNPQLPTIDVYATAPTTKEAVALANGAVTGFGKFVSRVETRASVTPSARIILRQLGGATGGVVDPAASKSKAAIIFLFVFALWCGLLLFVTSLWSQVRAERSRLPDDPRVDAVQGTIAVVALPESTSSSATKLATLSRRESSRRDLPSGVPPRT